MQGKPLAVQLGDTHGVVVYHAKTLAPEKLCAAFEKYGKTSVLHGFVLTDGNYATVVFFAEPLICATCYASLSRLAQGPENIGIVDVGWIHENGVDAFAKRPYVRHKYAPAVSTVDAGVSESNGYLVAYWKGVAEADRCEIAQMAHSSAIEVFEDSKEGGRLFLRFRSEDAADAFHSEVLLKFTAMRRSLSYADATDFLLAKGVV
ncbi:hypothetical protein LPMP_331750 [Leishmania panamensis]|uniref:Uncharacterized protein n=1 Tax=Leishmania panamensis TaxID=5679 RepID=A0A088SI11_LEIPA|nr:hypothetical protein LPMP_331750 [Leishmania panamensis]AIO01467.1 hypothetical protein LPMP_331750 [Leishmania panamensis]